MAGKANTLDCNDVEELSLEDVDSEDKIAEPYDVAADSVTLFSGVTPKNLESLLQTLAKIYKPASKEQEVITLALQSLLDNTKQNVTEELLESILELIQHCFHETKARPNAQKAIALEKTFAEKRSSGTHYCAVKQSWENIIFYPDKSEAELCQVSVELILQQVLQHFWSTGSSSDGNKEDTYLSNNCFSGVSPHDENSDNDTIRDHAGWAIKRARDVITKGHNQIPAKETVDEGSPIINADKSDALSVISLLGEDIKQPDGSYRLCVHQHVVPFFIFLHTLVETLLTPCNILNQKENILKYCLDQMSVSKELRKKWSDLTVNSDMRASVVVLQRIVTFFIKSKQQIFREKEGLKPNKNSMALRQQIRRSKSDKKSSTASPAPKKTNEEITRLRAKFACSINVNAFLLRLKTLTQSEQEVILAELQGKELGKILKALGQPAFLGKKKNKQIQTLVEALKAGMVNVKFPNEVIFTITPKQ